MKRTPFPNPYRPGAGHAPPYLAGRQQELDEFGKLLEQSTILENVVLTGLRGTGKTVLLDTFRSKAIDAGWGWVGTDLSESASISEEHFAVRLITDLAVVTSSIVIGERDSRKIGFDSQTETEDKRLDYECLIGWYQETPGLVSDKLKAILERVWEYWQRDRQRGIIFAYDEAQNLSDHVSKEAYPLSLMLDVFQSIQRKDIPFMLVLTGLPTLFPKLVEARTFAERMFRVLFLKRLDRKESRDAILKPIENVHCPVKFDEPSVEKIVEDSDGYPYFIQFICREVYDVFLQKLRAGERASVPVDTILRKLDTDFFAGRWARATDRQRELLTVIAHLEHADGEFTVSEIVEKSKRLLDKPFGSSHVNQMLVTLTNAGLIYKNRHGKYSFAVPLMGRFILRQEAGKL